MTIMPVNAGDRNNFDHYVYANYVSEPNEIRGSSEAISFSKNRIPGSCNNKEIGYQKIINSLSKNLLMIDSSGTIQFLNGKMIKMSGSGFKKIVGRSIFDLIIDDCFSHKLNLLKSKKKNNTEIIKLEFKRENAPALVTNCITNSIFDQNNRYIGTVFEFSDINNDAVRQTSSFEESLFDMAVTNKSQDEFFNFLCLEVEKKICETICAIILLDDDNRLYHASIPNLPYAYIKYIDSNQNKCSFRVSAGYKEQIIVSDISRDPLWEESRDVALMHGIKAC